MAYPLPPDVSDKLAELDKVPLFMQSLPDDDNPQIAALQSLIFDGPPDQVAQNFKDQGNEYFAGKRYREALGFYTQGIDAKPEDQAILQSLLLNRAAANLHLENYRSVLRDCSRVIASSNAVKAYYRSIQALIALDRPNDAIDCANKCPDQSAVSQLLVKAKAIKEKKDAILREKQRVDQAYKSRHLILKNDGSSPYSPNLDQMTFPVFFLYPQYATSDVIPDFQESTPFSAHIDVMFADYPPWDQHRQYSPANLVIYAITFTKRLLKIGKKMSLKDVFDAAKDGFELKDGCLSFVVLPKGNVQSDWVDKFKSNV